jgi:hypothetical protein
MLRRGIIRSLGHTRSTYIHSPLPKLQRTYAIRSIKMSKRRNSQLELPSFSPDFHVNKDDKDYKPIVWVDCEVSIITLDPSDSLLTWLPDDRS